MQTCGGVFERASLSAIHANSILDRPISTIALAPLHLRQSCSAVRPQTGGQISTPRPNGDTQYVSFKALIGVAYRTNCGRAGCSALAYVTNAMTRKMRSRT